MLHNTRRWQLRDATADEHSAVDRAIGAWDDLESYKTYLSSLHTFRAPIEQMLSAMEWPQVIGDWRPTMIAGAIVEDMEDLDIPLGPLHDFSVVPDADALLGALYVIEGSALGARILYKRAQALGLTDAFGARHLAVLSLDIQGWRSYLDILETAEPFDLGLALAASRTTFASAHTAFMRR